MSAAMLAYASAPSHVKLTFFATMVISVRLRINQHKDRLRRWKFDIAVCSHVTRVIRLCT
jgi:hypothetical protein